MYEDNEAELERLQAEFDKKKEERLKLEKRLEDLKNQLQEVQSDREVELSTLASQLEASRNVIFQIEKDTKIQQRKLADAKKVRPL